MLEEVPEPGFVCKDQKFYSTLNTETLKKVADKLGTDWKTMAALPQNTARYGALKASSKFKPGTLLYIPKKRSKWKMKLLSKTQDIESEECVDCGIESNPAEMLMCDGCDACHHVACVGLTCVPEGDWFCGECLEILHARVKHRDTNTFFELPSLLPLELSPDHEIGQTKTKLRNYLENRKVQAFANLEDYNKATRQSYQDRERELLGEISRIEAEITSAKREYDRVFWEAMNAYGVVGWSLGNFSSNSNWIKIKEDGRTIRLNQREETIEERTYNRIRGYYGMPWTDAVMSGRGNEQ
jgi:hypothetical protein